MDRRHLLKMGSLATLGHLARPLPLFAQQPKADFELRIAPVQVDLDPQRSISTIGYNGSAPGPLLRMKAGKPVTVDIFNETDTPELVHWHGMIIPAEADGTEEEQSPVVPPHGHRRVTFTPGPSGLRWYHSHAMAMDDLHKGGYTGQFGLVYVEDGNDKGSYDQELFLTLRDWEPFFSGSMEDDDDDTHDAPMLEKPPKINTDPNGLEVVSVAYSINDKALGAGDPIRVKQGQKLLIHFCNASPIENRRVALAGHTMRVIGLDGNPVPKPADRSSVFLGAGERADVEVIMNNPGVWILGGTEKMVREGGLGCIVEYAGLKNQPKWIDPKKELWDYTHFALPQSTQPVPKNVIDMHFEKLPRGMGKFNVWTINGKPYPHENEFVLQRGERYRLIMRNWTDDAHPMHLHRHLWEVVEMNGKKMGGLMKDTVVVPYYGRAVVDFTADQSGLSLFHCHIQQHMDYGFKALFRTT
ncbi:multicopper oxidase family protein [Terriglobus roseus]|uniref:Multicopper oxidase with three cupredoxin domains (Includes cell division protein FtsP and spore coat protein CotA) n=1 Tax=Terriglobus roseus TaxID=392734 RepID=A0A1G7QK45_9BACT|nr:multicopper oxidase domain-containing protein [Terriglobus roseus]SDF98862.1 Multicopper oxidase with three cupredoxin domains (includes cell division protein FtsP and spore coat protein CotA) [Terriglobus roseus]